MIHTLLYRCFRIYSDWTKFQLEFIKLMDVSKSNSYHENFINNYFKVFLDNKYRVPEKVITIPKKALILVLTLPWTIILQTRTKLRKSLKGILSCCKLQILLTNQLTLFVLKIAFQKKLHMVSFINFSVDSAMNPIVVDV